MSAAIRHIFYKPEIEELSIWFGPERRRYKYSGVPAFIYEALRDAESRGRYFNQSIRGRYECHLASPSERLNQRWEANRRAS